MSSQPSLVTLSLAIAQVTLRERARRRKLIAGVLMAILAVFVVGNWPLADFLGASIWLMLIWWGGCVFLCFFLALLALYDALSVVREEREKMGVGKVELPEE
ncbi:MAG: hypothetical protein ACSHYF_00715 [Verrucomicrobiaceae bacterium]